MTTINEKDPFQETTPPSVRLGMGYPADRVEQSATATGWPVKVDEISEIVSRETSQS